MSNWLGFVNGDGEKILEYVQDKPDVNKPHEVKDDLWFIPVKSKNVPSFNGIYVQRPYYYNDSIFNTNRDTYADTFYKNIDEVVATDPNYWAAAQSTLFVTSDNAVDFYKKFGFKRVYNIKIFENDVWEIAGIKDCRVTVAFHIQMGSNMGSYLNIVNLNENFHESVTIQTAVNYLYKPIPDTFIYIDNSGSFFSVPTGEKNSDGSYKTHLLQQIETYQKQGDNIINRSIRFVAPYMSYKSVDESTFEALWGKQESKIPKNTIRVYKDIFLMNGAKIMNEDGTLI